jgi:hypothetical protein
MFGSLFGIIQAAMQMGIWLIMQSNGQAALYTSMKRFQQIYGPTNLQFAAYIIFYPDCGTTYKSDERLPIDQCEFTMVLPTTII